MADINKLKQLEEYGKRLEKEGKIDKGNWHRINKKMLDETETYAGAMERKKDKDLEKEALERGARLSDFILENNGTRKKFYFR